MGRDKMAWKTSHGTYEGDYKNGKSHGQGTRKYTWEYLHREFQGKLHGKGTMKYKNGDIFMRV